MSTEKSSNGRKPRTPIKLDLDKPPTATDEALDTIQNELIAEKDARREERFIWFAVVVVMFDALIFPPMANWTAPLVIGVLEVILFLALGRKWGMDHIWTLTETLASRWNGSFKN